VIFQGKPWNQVFWQKDINVKSSGCDPRNSNLPSKIGSYRGRGLFRLFHHLMVTSLRHASVKDWEDGQVIFQSCLLWCKFRIFNEFGTMAYRSTFLENPTVTIKLNSNCCTTELKLGKPWKMLVSGNFVLCRCLIYLVAIWTWWVIHLLQTMQMWKIIGIGKFCRSLVGSTCMY